jgi:hypothetical protein
VARAQYGATPFHDPATGETYHIEASVGLWNPPPLLTVSSESLGIAGTDIDAVNTLGIQQKRLYDLRLVLRPARKHKFRLNYLPMAYLASKRVPISFVFNGLAYGINLPVSTDFRWKTLQLAYEYDFLYHDRWFVGLVLESKFTDIDLVLDSPITQVSQPGIACIDQPDAVAHACAKAPIPNLGDIVRVYVVPNISITGEMVGIKIPDSVSTDYKAHYFDFDLYGTVNFNKYAGVQVGYRSLDVGYAIKTNKGTFLMKGLYFGGVVRY